MTRASFKIASLLVAAGFAGASHAAVIGTADVGNFGPGGFIDGGVDPAAQNVVTTGSITATVTYTGQWGSESGSAAVDLEDNHVFDGEAGFTAHTGQSTMTLVIDGLTAGQTYDIAARWRGQANAATNAPYSITGFDGGVQNTTANQEAESAADFTFGPDSLAFETLFTGVASGTSVTLTLNNNADEFVVADAFLVNQVPEPGSLALVGLGGLALLRRRRA